MASATATVGNVHVMNTRLRKEKRHQSQQPADTSHDDLKKKYESLQKDYKRVGQNQELTTLLEEREKEAEELANLVQNKDKVVEKPREALLKRKEGHRRTPSGGATQRPTLHHKKTHPHHNSNTSRWQTFASAPTAWPTYTNDMTRFSRQ